ncbi:MAG: hypothetical protein RJA44_1725 [Pseudomonadota bacterium]
MSKTKLLLISLGGAVLLLCLAVFAGKYFKQDSRPRTVDEFMAERYVLLDEKKRIWGEKNADGTADQDRSLRLDICASNHEQKDLNVFLLAVCGRAGENVTHIDSGTIDMYAINRSTGPFEVVAESHMDGFGSMGEPGEIKILRLGRAFWGFQIEGGFTGQGITVAHTRLYVPHKDDFTEALNILSFYGNGGVTEDKDQQTEINREIVPLANGTDNTYKLKISETSRGKASKVYMAGFDTAQWRYNYPKQLADDPEL